jgi:fructose-1,6-bisphosphatase/sedoheptulose 1,7-bisphosphatase-like protein
MTQKKKKKTYSTIPIDLPLPEYERLKKVAKLANISVNKLVNVILAFYIVTNSEETD